MVEDGADPGQLFLDPGDASHLSPPFLPSFSSSSSPLLLPLPFPLLFLSLSPLFLSTMRRLPPMPAITA